MWWNFKKNSKDIVRRDFLKIKKLKEKNYFLKKFESCGVYLFSLVEWLGRKKSNIDSNRAI